MIVQSSDINKPVRESADVCIIGSGCGGGASAKVLAQAGKRVIVVEEGGYFKTEDFQPTEEFAFTNLYRQRAGQATDNLAVTVLQGKCVGGSSTVNWTTSLRTPEFVLERWAKDFGVEGMGTKDLDPYFARIERYLNIHVEPDENHNLQNRIILDGAKKLGYRAKASGRNTKDCAKIGACGLGCPIGAKLSVDVTYIPDAEKAGATVFAGFRADKIEVNGLRKRVIGTIIDRSTQKANIGFRHRSAGRRRFCKLDRLPSLAAEIQACKFQRTGGKTSYVPSHDLPCSEYSTIPCFHRAEFLSRRCATSSLNKNGDGGGFWMEAVPATPTLAALAIPGFGAEHRALMRQYPNIGATIVLVKEIDSEGRVTVNDYGRPSISYNLGAKDLEYLKQGLKATAEVQFAAGAKEVLTLHTTKTSFKSVDEIDSRLSRRRLGNE